MILFKEFVLRLSKIKNLPSSLINIFLLINWKKQNVFHIFKDNILNEEFFTDEDKIPKNLKSSFSTDNSKPLDSK